MKKFALTGAAGYIAPRHLKAIQDTNNVLVAALDPHDSVGILDRYFPQCSFFTEFERFDRHLERIRRDERGGIDYLTICTPNYLHDAHCRLALRLGASAICEKPLVVNPWQLDALQRLEEDSGGSIYTILQLRVHPSLIELKNRIANDTSGKRYQVNLSYITSRGPWYMYSWKGDVSKSGGVAANIGIHFFDMLMWMFGKQTSSDVYLKEKTKMSGFMELENADVTWFLSIDKTDLPQEMVDKGQPTYRSITVNGEEIEFSGGFTDLHTRVYENTLAGNGFTTAMARPAIEVVHGIYSSEVSSNIRHGHPFLMERIS
ncbi:MAG: Gfo/Idh/MocA family oxidoreductase [Bacteroidia bacterium]|nr:Gfo/Idh/MocA family oxidoreductase [Bacteroidia bacterium]